MLMGEIFFKKEFRWYVEARSKILVIKITKIDPLTTWS